MLGRLVEQQRRGRRDQRPGQQQSPALAGRHRRRATDEDGGQPVGQPVEPLPSPTRCSACRSSSSVASPRATSRLSRTVVANRCASSAKNTASGFGHVISRVVLPQPLGPDDRDAGTGGQLQGRNGRATIVVAVGSVSVVQSPRGDPRAGQRDGGAGQCRGRLERRQRQQHQDRDGGGCDGAATARSRRSTAPSTLIPIAAVGAAAATAAGAAARSTARPQSRCRRCGFGDDAGQPAARPAARARARAQAWPRCHAANDARPQRFRPPTRRGLPHRGAARPRSAGRARARRRRRGRSTAITATAATPRTAATQIGTTARTSTSDSSSTSAPIRATSSPLCSRITASTGPRGEPAIEPLAGGARRAQRGVVGGQPLAVAEHAAGDAERAHRDHRDRQVQHRRHLPGPGDQPRRHPGQRQRAAQRPRPERDGQQQPRQPRPQQLPCERLRLRDIDGPHVDDDVADRQHRLPVPDDDHRRACGRPAPRWRRSTRSFGRRVEVRGGLVEQQHRRRRAEHPGESESLALTRATGRHRRGRSRCAARRASSASTSSKPAARQAAVEVGQRPEQLEVVAHGAGDQDRSLRQPRHLGPPLLQIQFGHVDPVDATRPAGGRGRGSPAAAWSCRCRWTRQDGHPAGFESASQTRRCRTVSGPVHHRRVPAGGRAVPRR